MLTCSFGTPWTATGCGPCAGCQAFAAELDARFAAAVAAGVYDAQGYTKADRDEQQRHSVAKETPKW